MAKKHTPLKTAKRKRGRKKAARQVPIKLQLELHLPAKDDVDMAMAADALLSEPEHTFI